MSQSTTTPNTPPPSSLRPKSKPNVSAPSSSSPTLHKSRAKSVPPDVKKVRRSLPLSHPKSADQPPTHTQRGFNRAVEQFARPRRPHRLSDAATTGRNIEQESISKKELREKLELSESLIKNLDCEVLGLKAELEKAHSFNRELLSRNDKLSQDLAAAQAKIAALSSRPQDSTGENPKFKDIQKLISFKLEHSAFDRESTNGSIAIQTPPPPPPPPRVPKPAAGRAKAPSCPSLPPPPPPPPLRPLSKARASTAPKPPAIVEFYHALRKQEDKRDTPALGNHYKSAAITAHSSIVGEIQNRSAHLLAIKVDIETKGDFIKSLIQKVVTAAYTDIEDVLKFVDWLDAELSSLVDERAVLKHFNWPERKADAIREAAVEYRGLKQLESEISSFKDDTSIPCGNALKKISVLLDKSERGIQRLIKLRNSVMRSYQDWKIPTDWMLDSGIVSKIKQASMRLAKMYMGRVMMELELGRTSDRESNQEALLLQGVHFAYRTHQFAGGLDSETLCAFEEMRQRVPGHLGRCQELLLAGIPSS